MRTWKAMLAGLLVVLAVPACGGSDDDTGNAQQQCDALVNRFCESAIGCEVSGGLITAAEKASALASCKTDANNAVECSKAQRVTSSYDACMSKLSNPPCDEVNQAIKDNTLGLPSECEGVILVSD